MRRLVRVVLLASLAACGSGSKSGAGSDGGQDGDGGTEGHDDAGLTGLLEIEPAADQFLDVIVGQAVPTISYSATLGGVPVSVAWAVDRGEVGTVGVGVSSDTVFTPSAAAGGIVTIYAGVNGQVVERRVMVSLHHVQNGPSGSVAEQAQIPADVDDLTAGGGVGGVGGEGVGGQVTDSGVLDALDNPTGDGSAQSLKLLYPYDDTIWPRGLPAPLLQWDWSIGNSDAIKIELQTSSGSYRYTGTFSRPAILTDTGGAFIRHPVPQDAWNAATDSAGGTTVDGSPDLLVLRLTVASGGAAYGPIEQTYRVAPARLAGTIYYQSYGTNLAKNFTGAVGGDGAFGGAVLSIKVGDTAPQLAAGSSGSPANCRVCHSVAAGGSRLVSQTSSPTATYAFDVTPESITEHSLSTNTSFPGITADGAFALTAGGQLLDLANGASVATTGLSDITNLGTPMFSPGGDKIVFNPMSGSGAPHPTRSLAVMDFDQTTRTFSNLVEIIDNTGLPADVRPGWAAFSPDGQSIVYQHQIEDGSDGNGHGDLRTRKGAKAYLAWTKADGTAASTPLDQANGAAYLPQLANPVSLTCTGDGVQVGGIDNTHADDVNLNYEPTINPIVSGGYVWVVFTSRRMYGNVAAIPPFCSDPRGVNLITNITPKKLWVAAIDLNAPAGTDPSHPAFYLPAQEILAGNARGFWVLDPCRQDGASCGTGDQCCNGFCSPNEDGALECSSEPSGECSMPQEACETAADCCSSNNQCINNFCAFVVE